MFLGCSMNRENAISVQMNYSVQFISSMADLQFSSICNSMPPFDTQWISTCDYQV